MPTRRPARTAERRRSDRGVSSIELAVIAPTLLALIFLVIQAALYFYGRSVALQAAREGVSELRLYQTADDCTAARSDISKSTEDYSTAVGDGALESPSAVSTCDYSAGGNSTVTVHVTGHAISLLGFTLSIDESVTGRVEQFQDNG